MAALIAMEVEKQKRSLSEATKELQLLQSLAPAEMIDTAHRGTAGWFGEQMTPSSDSQASKLHKPDNKGRQAGKGLPGKGNGRGQNKGPKVGQRGRARGSGPAWKGQDARSQRQPQDTWTEDVEEEPEDLGDLKTMVKLLTALVLRHESQHCINRLDTGFVIFLQTDIPNSVAVSTYRMAQRWHAVKNLSENEQELMGLKWDQEAHRHVRDVSVTPIRIDEAMETPKEPLVVARYHATRPLSEQYQAPTLTMLLEIGLRTSAAHTVWSGLNKLTQSAMWVAAGAFLRQERIQRSPLAQKLAALSKSLG